jgi:hypothetical protein
MNNSASFSDEPSSLKVRPDLTKASETLFPNPHLSNTSHFCSRDEVAPLFIATDIGFVPFSFQTNEKDCGQRGCVNFL